MYRRYRRYDGAYKRFNASIAIQRNWRRKQAQKAAANIRYQRFRAQWAAKQRGRLPPSNPYHRKRGKYITNRAYYKY